MKNYQIAFICSLFLATICLLNNYSAYGLNVNFDGSGGDNYGYGNVPMPGDPTPVGSYNTQSSTSTSTYSSPKTHTYHAPTMQQQMQLTIMSSIIQGVLDSSAQSKQAALEAQKRAAEQKKLEEAKKKKDAQKWLKDYQEDSGPKITNIDSPVGSLKGLDPVWPKKGDYLIPPAGQTTDPYSEGIKIPKIQPAVQNISNVSKPLHPQSEFMTPGRTEGQLREMYFNSDRQLMQCASGKMECAPELVKQLEVKRLTAEQGLVTSYKYKVVNGEFIKKPD